MKERTFVKRAALLVLLVLVAGFVFAGGKQEAAETNAGMSKGTGYKDTLVVALEVAPTTMDPMSVPYTLVNQIVHYNAHSRLIGYNWQEQELFPLLAESWDISDDGLTYTFHLRKGAKFHNGEEVKASDVEFSLERYKETGKGQPLFGAVENIEIVDDYTLVFNLNGPAVDFLMFFTRSAASILSKKAMTEDPENGFEIGAGPFKYNEFILNDYVLLDKNQDYWNADAVKSEHIKYRLIGDSSARVVALHNAEIDYCAFPSVNELTYIADDPNLTLHQVPGTLLSWLGFNCKSELGGNMKLRQAIASAIKKDDIITVAMDGLGKQATVWWGSSTYGLDENAGVFDYDLAKAKQLIAEAGYPNGLDLEMICMAEDLLGIQVIQAQLKEIGINLIVRELELSALINMLVEGENDSVMIASSFDPNATAQQYHMVYDVENPNLMHYESDEVVELINAGATELDDAKRRKIYSDVQSIMATELPYIPLYYGVTSWGTVNNFDGLNVNAAGGHDFSFSYVTE